MLEKDILLAKLSVIRNCLQTIKKVTGLNPEKLEDHIVQDVFVLNLQRSIQACSDIANVLIARRGLKLPASYRESFLILKTSGILDAKLTGKMIKMVGFRNIAVHDYQALNPDILKSILKSNLEDLEQFYSVIYELIQKSEERQ